VRRLVFRRGLAPGLEGRTAAARGGGTPVARLYEKTLRQLARRGLARRPSETPREFAARVAASGVGGSDVLDRITDLYTGARFGRRAVADEPLRELAARLSEIGRAPPPSLAARS